MMCKGEMGVSGGLHCLGILLAILSGLIFTFNNFLFQLFRANPTEVAEVWVPNPGVGGALPGGGGGGGPVPGGLLHPRAAPHPRAQAPPAGPLCRTQDRPRILQVIRGGGRGMGGVRQTDRKMGNIIPGQSQISWTSIIKLKILSEI